MKFSITWLIVLKETEIFSHIYYDAHFSLITSANYAEFRVIYSWTENDVILTDIAN